MRVTAAVLSEVARRPYDRTAPLDLVELELDRPGPGELLVRITAAGLCHSDLSVVNGDRVRPLPMALGHEAAGIVEAVGEGASDVRVGDQVVLVYVPSCGACTFCREGRPALCEPGAAANGAGELLGGGRRLHRATPRGRVDVHHHLGVSAFADHAVVDRSSAVVVGHDVPAPVAALLGCATATGYGALARTAGVRAGDSVAVFGLGGVGLAAVMAARALGAGRVVAVDPVAAKRARALELGATDAVAPDAAADAVGALPGGGARWAFEAVGSVEVLAAAVAATGRGGTTVAIGLPHPSAQLSVPALPIVADAKTITGSYMGSTRPAVDVPAMADLWREGRLPVERLISDELPLSEVDVALERLADGSALRQVLRP